MKPNIVLILTDHFRRDTISPEDTPNLHKLALDGVRFEAAYSASPLCQPARNAIIGGLYNFQSGICGNQAEPFGEELRRDTFMHHLQKVGYHTSLVGKHHYIDRFGTGTDVIAEDQQTVESYGFDHVFQVLDDYENWKNADEYTRHLESKGLLTEIRERFEQWDNSNMIHCFDNEDDTVDGFIKNHALECIRQSDGEKPFYLNVGFVGPHPPYWYPKEAGKYNPEDLRTTSRDLPEDAADTAFKRAAYMNRCAILDRYVGELVDALKEKGQYENTLILFSSDHGDMLGEFGIWDKRFFYEPSVGVPFILAGAGIEPDQRMNRGRVDRSLVSHLDIYPTFLSAAGMKLPEKPKRAGINLLAKVNGDGLPVRDAVFSELGTAVMVRTGNWKLVYDPQAGGVQYLFNLTNDPHEETNLANVPGYEAVSLELVSRILNERIRLTQYAHLKEEQRVMRISVDY